MGNQRIRVRLEPALEEEVMLMTPAKRRELARKLYRWAKQLWLSADIIERDNAPKVKPTALKPLMAKRARWN